MKNVLNGCEIWIFYFRSFKWFKKIESTILFEGKEIKNTEKLN